MTVERVEVELGGRTLTIETGKMAKQADGAVTVQLGETVVLGTVVRAKPRRDIDFFPLAVDYREKMNAAGKIPGVRFRRREGAPSTKEIVTMRNIDRPLRPLFPKGFFDEVQIQCWVLAADGQNEPDVLAGIAASAAVSLSTLPFDGPVGNVRVGRVDGQFVIFPTGAQMEYSDLDLLLCGHSDDLNMIEVRAHELSEEVVSDAISFGFDHVKQITAIIDQLVSRSGKPKVGDLKLPSDDVVQLAREKLAGPLRQAKTTEGTKLDRQEAVRNAIDEFLKGQFPEPDESASYKAIQNWQAQVGQAKMAVEDLEEAITREVILTGIRTDGRRPDELRPITCETGVLPRVHGSALFTRGETQALVTITLGTGRDELTVESLAEEYAEKFYLHYNFPPFSVGEVKRISGPSRRDIGHGMLAQRSLQPVLPSVDEFPYTVRAVSDILESNGSSSMASATGGTLALMDAGVPIKAPVAGISIGLIKEGDQELYLTDIQGEEDHFGDMDFKVAGTSDGITAIQLDLKIRGINMAQIAKTFELARKNRLEIISMIKAELPQPRSEISIHAPRLLTIKINPDKIGLLIGPGGKMIRAIEERTGANLEIEEDGTVLISSVGAEKAQAALEEVEKLCAEVKTGQIYTGKVSSIKDFGAFIEVVPGQDGLCHISELKDGFVEKVSDVISLGEEVRVKVLSIDEQGRVKLSRRAALAEEADQKNASVGAET